MGGGRHPALLYIHPEGKLADAGSGGRMEWFVRNGYAVLAPDLIGTGETGPGVYEGDAYNFKVGKANYNVWFAALRIGRSIAGIRAGDTVRLARYLDTRPDIEAGNISAVAFGTMCPVLLHAAAFDQSLTKITLIEPLVSYRSLVMNRYYGTEHVLNSVAGALTAYDLADLAACIAPRELVMVNVAGHDGEKAGRHVQAEDMAVVQSAYTQHKAREKFRVPDIETIEAGMDEIFSSE